MLICFNIEFIHAFRNLFSVALSVLPALFCSGVCVSGAVVLVAQIRQVCCGHLWSCCVKPVLFGMPCIFHVKPVTANLPVETCVKNESFGAVGLHHIAAQPLKISETQRKSSENPRFEAKLCSFFITV